ncbi:hypothetical protein ADE_47300 [Achromobacter denitrificans]|nr:hypothetical protein ADE_47300 [Achromobacter denitrificans]
MFQVDSVIAAGAARGTVRRGDEGGVAQPQGQHHGPRLHAGALLRHDELAAGEIPAGFGQQRHALQREYVLAIVLLVQRDVAVLAQQAEPRQRARLARLMAAMEEIRQFVRVAAGGAQPLAPAVGDGGEMAVEGLAPCRQRLGQRGRKAVEIARARRRRIGGQQAQRARLLRRQPAGQQGIAFRVELRGDVVPVQQSDGGRVAVHGDPACADGVGDEREFGLHGFSARHGRSRPAYVAARPATG